MEVLADPLMHHRFAHQGLKRGAAGLKHTRSHLHDELRQGTDRP